MQLLSVSRAEKKEIQSMKFVGVLLLSLCLVAMLPSPLDVPVPLAFLIVFALIGCLKGGSDSSLHKEL